MDQRNENARIDGIIQSGKFVWKGNVYTVDIAQTRKDNSNYVSAERPVKYLHGVSESGTPVKAWAHECSEYSEPVTEELVDDQPQDAPEILKVDPHTTGGWFHPYNEKLSIEYVPPQDAPVFIEPIEPEVMNEQPVVIQEDADVSPPKQPHRSKKHKH